MSAGSCGTTRGTMCRAASALGGERAYHAPCALVAGHAGWCLCPACGAVITHGASATMCGHEERQTDRHDVAIVVLLVLGALAAVAGADAEVRPLAALTGAGWLRWLSGR